MYMIHKLKPKAHFNPSFIMYGGSCLCIFGVDLSVQTCFILCTFRLVYKLPVVSHVVENWLIKARIQFLLKLHIQIAFIHCLSYTRYNVRHLIYIM